MKSGTNLTVNNKVYTFIKDYKNNEEYRKSLNLLTQKTYGFDFEQWYQHGFWSDNYRPYSLLQGNEVVANVSVNTMEFLINGERKPVLQIGTVITDSAFRHQGLSRELMHIVFNEYEATYELIYLYANDTVLEFYPRFGFVEAEEYIYTKQVCRATDRQNVRKINMQEAKDRELVIKLVENTVPVSRYSMVNNPGLVMFYLTSFMSDNIYYIEEQGVLAVAEFEDNKLLLTDLFCEKEFNLDEVIQSLLVQEEMTVSLGFTPADTGSFAGELLKEEGTTFFVKGTNWLEKGRFPVLSHA